MFRKIFQIIILLSLLSCKNDQIINEKIEDREIIIELKQKINTKIQFRNNFSLINAKALIDRFPEYYKHQLSYKGIDNIDSTIISTLNTDREKFYYDLFKEGFINNSDYVSLRIDSIKRKN